MEFDDFYRANFHAVVALVYGLAGSRWAAEELAQDAFLSAHRRWDQVSGYDNPAAWVRRVAINGALSRLRRRSAEARALVRFVANRQPRPLELDPPDAEFWAAVRGLPKGQAAVAALHYCEDLRIVDIAEVLGISEGTVKTQLHRARASLAETLGVQIEEERGT